MKFVKFIPALLAAAALSFSSCGIDEPENPDDPDNPDSPVNPAPNPNLTPEEIKEQVADIALDFLNNIDNNSQQQLAEMASYIAETYGNLKFDPEGAPASAPLRNLARSYQIIDVAGDIPSGMYTPDGYNWAHTGESDDLIFCIPNDMRYGRIVLTVKTSGQQNANVTVPEEGDYHVIAPTTVEATLTVGGQEIISHKLNINFNQGNKTMSATETLVAANLYQTSTINATNTKAEVSTTASVNNQQLVSSTATVSGRDLCDLDRIAEAVDNETVDRMFSTVSFEGNIMNRLYCTGTAKALGEVVNAWNSYYDFGPNEWYEYQTEQEASDACDKAIALINRNVAATASFAKGQNSIAALTFIKDEYKYSYSGYTYGDFYPMAAMKFNDGTTYTDDYFEYGFEAVIDRWESLIRVYENLCD